MENKKKLFLVILVLSSLIEIINCIIHFDTFDFNYIGNLLQSFVIVGALIFGVVEKKYLAVYMIIFIKILVPNGGTFINDFINSHDISTVDYIIGPLSIILFGLSFYHSYDLIKRHKFEYEKPKFREIIAPFLVFLFYAAFKTVDMGFQAAISELLVLLLVANIAENLLWVAAFIYIPFSLIQKLIDSNTFEFIHILEYTLGFMMLFFAVKNLISSLSHLKHEEEH